MLGNLSNSNFVYSDRSSSELAKLDITTELDSFYLSELPQISFSNRLDTNNGAKVAEKLTSFSQGNLFGISVGEILANNNSNNNGYKGYVPGILTGQSTYKVLKAAQKLSISLKTRILYEPNESGKQKYTDLLDKLMMLSLPSDEMKFSSTSLIENLSQTLGGVPKTISNAIDTDAINLSALGNAVVGNAKALKTAGQYVFENDKANRVKLKQQFNDQKGKISDYSEKVGSTAENFINALVKDFIYREYITLTFSRLDEPILEQISKNGTSDNKFILKSFDVSQSNQLYGDTMNPVYMDFSIELESLGVIINERPISASI